MFTSSHILKNVKSSFLYKDELIICTGDGIFFYRENEPVKVSGIAPWFACIFGELFLFQEDNGGAVHYFRKGNEVEHGILEGQFYLYRSMIDGRKIYLPHDGILQEFDHTLRFMGRYQVGRIPFAVHHGKYYRLFPHLSCFSLEDNGVQWTMENKDLLEEVGGIPQSYFYQKNDLLIIRSKFINWHNFVTAFNPDNGAIAWQQRGQIPATTFLGDQIYGIFYLHLPDLRGRFTVIDSKTGDLLKDVDITNELAAHGFRPSDYYLLAKQDSYLYIAAGYGKTLYAFNMDTAKIDWMQPVNTKAGWLSNMKLYNNRLFIIDEAEDMHVFARSPLN